jgi:hypothetical protein
MALMPFDKVYIRTAPNYEAQKSVYIDGEIAYPGSYTIKIKRNVLAIWFNWQVVSKKVHIHKVPFFSEIRQ